MYHHTFVRRGMLFAVMLLVMAPHSIGSVWAQDRNAEIETLKKQMEELRRREAERQQQLEELQRRLDMLHSQPGVAAPPARPPHPSTGPYRS